MIDLHLHTNASDGVLAPDALVEAAIHAGITILSVTDHDTTSGLQDARAAAERRGVRLVAGIEITAVERERDVHVLGYFFDASSPSLGEFLESQRADRRRRVKEMAARLNDLGCAVDPNPILERSAGAPGRSIGRPLLADALVAAGYVASRREAFDVWLGEGRPAFVPRCGARPADVVEVIHRAGGIAALAHPGLLEMDDIIPPLASQGLDAIEAIHRDHDVEAERRYRALAAALGVAVSGGSDFHGEDGRHRELGEVFLPDGDFALLEARARSKRGSGFARS